MPVGEGKYDRIAGIARTLAEAKGIIMLIIGGRHGHGFTAQLPDEGDRVEAIRQAARILRETADQMETDANEMES